ncbi:MAG: response regulator, partial [Planctomycetaceae bacterium]|nr:response regulator [Planctomycetaceae bacterium]
DHNFFYFFRRTVATITPMSLSDLHELSHTGQVFSVVLVFCGVGSALLFATQFARILVASELQGVGIFTRRQMEKRIKGMRNHYIVCGFDEIGQSICIELAAEGLAFVVVTANEEYATQAVKLNYAVVRGNPTTDAALKEAGVERAAGVIAAMTTDADNLFIALSARELNPQILVISRGEEAGVDHRMLRAGADIVVSPMKLGGQQIARLILQQSGKFTEKTEDNNLPAPVLGFSLRIYRPKENTTDTVANAIKVTGAMAAVAIQHHEGHTTTNPPLETAVLDKDVLVLLMKSEGGGDERLASEQSIHTILLADDHRALRMLFTRKIQSAGHEVIEAATGEEALRLAQQHHPDLIVLDVLMPGMSGYQVCKALRGSGFETTPIILYSGENDDDFPVQGQEAGANRCLRKSSKSSELLTEIENLLSENQREGKGANLHSSVHSTS